MTKKSITVRGKNYPSVRAATIAQGINYGNVVRRLNSGWSMNQAFEFEPAPERKAPNASKLITNKGEFQSIREAARAYNILESTISQRLRLGWSDKQAVGEEAPPIKRTKRGKPVICASKKFPSINEFADAYGKNRTMVRKRLLSGWTPEQSVELDPKPPRFRNQDGSVRDHAWTAKTVTSKGETVPVSAIGKYTLYLITDLKSKREYVGITTGNIKSRLRGHWNQVNEGRQSKLYNRMRKALNEGRRKDFVIQILRDDARSYEELQTQEYEEIKSRNTINNGFNTAHGGSLGTPNPITVDGKEFISQQAAAEYYGVDVTNFNQRINKLGWTPEQAAGLDPQKSYGVELDIQGIKYKSISAACKQLGKDYKKVHARLNKYGWTLEQAFDLAPPPLQNKSPNAIKIVSSIGQFDSIGDAAKAVGVEQGTISSRLRKGWTHDEALGLTPRNKN